MDLLRLLQETLRSIVVQDLGPAPASASLEGSPCTDVTRDLLDFKVYGWNVGGCEIKRSRATHP